MQPEATNNGDALSPPDTGAERPPQNERLHSWKEIAAYLRHGLRTVQRWEQTEGLPVHRHPHEKRDAVWAYREELDTWWASRRAQLSPEEESIPVEMLVGAPPLTHRIAEEKRMRRKAVFIAALALLLVTVIWLARRL